jgi:hypothetical protein
MFGLSFLCKELAVVMFGATLVYLIVKRVGKWRILWFTGVGFLVAFLGLWIYDLVWGPSSAVVISNPVIHLLVMLQYQLKLNGVVRNASSYPWVAPWSWVSPFGVNAFEPTKWIWLSVGGRTIYAWLSQPNVVVEYLMFPLLITLPILYWVKRNSVALLSWLWISFSFLPWLIAGLFVKTEGNFYIVYSVPFLAIGCTYLYSLIPNRKLKYALAFTQLSVGLLCFLYYFPLPLLR